MNPCRQLIAVLSLVSAWGLAQAADAPPADLPATGAVLEALDNHPRVRAAQAELRAARAEHDRLRAGSHEYALRLSANRRQVAGGPDHNEWEAVVERALRLPEKARLDEGIGARGVEEAEERVGEARHETARQLLALWYAALQAEAEARLWREQLGLLTEEGRIVQQRVRRGDAARLDTLQVEAAVSQARSRLAQAEARARTVQAELRAAFPGLPEPDQGQAETPLPAGGEAEWIEHTLEHNHELRALQRAVEKTRLLARRAESERTPDPTLGLRYANEQGGDERLLGLSLSLALPGEGRRAAAGALAAQAEALAEMEAGARRRLAAEAAANWQRAAGEVLGHQRLKEAAAALGRHADLAARAHQLGELGLAEVLLARRQALEARLAAEQSRLAANEAIARLLLDAHRLWQPQAEHH